MTIVMVTSINDLPNELLSIIFAFLYHLHWMPLHGDDYGHWFGDSFEPSMFPFAQAKVCQRWCALLAYHPRYWTRIPVVVDPATTPLHHVPNYLAWSQDLPVKVSVKSHPEVHNIDEGSYVDAILPFISQHLYHIKTIWFSLHHTSIPILPRWFVGPANLLESIQLSHEGCTLTGPCVTVAHGHDSDLQVGRDVEIRFSAPNLALLSIDWRTFVQACRMNGSWLANAPELRSIDIYPTGPCSSCSPMEDFSVGDTINALSHGSHLLGNLSIECIPFADGGEPFEPPATATFNIDYSLILEGLKGTEVETFIVASGSGFVNLAIKNCSIRGLGDFVAYSLTLEDLNEDCNLTETFQGDVRSCEVSILNCFAFDDAFLEFMADGGPMGEGFPAKGIGSLVLEQCTNFSVDSLYRMVLARRTAMEASLQWDGTEAGLNSGNVDHLSAITFLQVVCGPPLSEEYRAKFEQVIPELDWTDVADVTRS